MKKIFYILLFSAITLPVCAIAPPDAAIIQVHDMQMINQQRFRREVLDDYNDVQTEKERFEKKNSSREPLINKLFHKKKFVEENGEIKIENDDSEN